MSAALTDSRRLLEDLVRTRAQEAGLAWLDKALASLAGEPSVGAVLNAYAGASRRLGKQALALEAAEQEAARAVDEALPLEHWGLDEAARALLLLHVADLPEDAFVERALACYDKGDSREQESWLRGLAVLPFPERFVMTAVDACRTNIIPVFEAVACENPYPWRHFAELNFNQMVLKALFNSIALERIVGLTQRRNPDLARMADDYVSEREAAGRVVPADIWLVIAPFAGPEALERVYRYLAHEGAPHRYWAAQALAAAPHAAGRLERLREQLGQEPDGRVRSAIESALHQEG